MYWYKSAKSYLLWLPVALTIGATSCKPDVKVTGGRYFSLKSYFRADSSRLARQSPTVKKTVAYNGNAETKKVKITNWGRELELFSGSDINKPAWRQSYVLEGDTSSVFTYKARTPELRTQLISVRKQNGAVKYIYIVNHEHNILYDNTEKLTYIPDSLYQIDKVQQVKFLGTNKYLIKGVF